MNGATYRDQAGVLQQKLVKCMMISREQHKYAAEKHKGTIDVSVDNTDIVYNGACGALVDDREPRIVAAERSRPTSNPRRLHERHRTRCRCRQH
jgi:hypothetical protein